MLAAFLRISVEIGYNHIQGGVLYETCGLR